MATKKKKKKRTTSKKTAKRTAKRKAAKGDRSAMDLIVAELEKDRNVAYADVKAKAERKGLVIYPIMYGRAKALLGLVPTAPRGSKKKGRKKAARATAGNGRRKKTGRRGPGRPRTTAAPLDSLNEVVAEFRAVQKERDQLRRALEKIAGAVNEAL